MAEFWAPSVSKTFLGLGWFPIPGAHGAIAPARLLPGLAAALVVRPPSSRGEHLSLFVLPNATLKGGRPSFPFPLTGIYFLAAPIDKRPNCWKISGHTQENKNPRLG